MPAIVNPDMLVWAREEAGYSEKEAAERAKVTIEKLRSWERNETQPTLRQAELLARIYDRAFSLFSLPTPPQEPPLSAEYRHLPGVKPGGEPPDLRRAFRRLVHRRRLALYLFEELGTDPPDFPIRAHLREEIEELGRRVRAMLEVSLETQFGWRSEFAAFRAWRAAVEHLGVLVCQMPGVSIDDLRGTSIVHFPLPVIGVSSKELPLSKPFTLIHELAHLALAASEEERPASEEKRDGPSWLEVERYCESVAGAVLMPPEAIESDRNIAAQRNSRSWTVSGMRSVAKHFKATPTAVATRLLRIGIMSPSAYTRWKADWAKYTNEHPGGPSFGIATQAEKAVNRNGPLFTSLVLSALSSDRITSVDACHYLNLGFEHVETLRRGWIETPMGLASAVGE